MKFGKMLNTEIKYKTSTDYKRLFKLLKDGNIIIGFIAICINGEPNDHYSSVKQMSYEPEYKIFNLGFSFFESDFNKIGFEELCLKQKVRFIDINENLK